MGRESSVVGSGSRSRGGNTDIANFGAITESIHPREIVTTAQ